MNDTRPGDKETGLDNWPGAPRQPSAPDAAGPHMEDAALALAAAGAEVVPLHTAAGRVCSCAKGGACATPGKHPRTLHGHLDATSDPEKIRHRWRRWPTANIGVRPAEGVVVLDVDPRKRGATHLVDLLDGRRLPPTLTTNTGSGGLHIWYAVDAPHGYEDTLCVGVDLKARNGLVVVPPSLHAAGRRYSWGTTLPITPAPEWLAELVRKPAAAPRPPLPPRWRTGAPSVRRARAAALACRVAAVAERGDARTPGRNSTLFWAACRAIEDGITCDETSDQLRAAARAAGLGDAEIERVLDSALVATGVKATRGRPS